MKLMSVDQSLSHCAVVIWDDEAKDPENRYMIRTGSTSSKGKRKADVVYFDTVYEQIWYICERINILCEEHGVDTYVMESLALSAMGSATRDLAGLFYALAISLNNCGNHLIDYGDIHLIAPTSVKSFARTLLPEEERTIMKERVDKKTGKKVQSKAQLVMKKPEMVRATQCAVPGWLDGLTLDAGKADFADAYLIGRAFLARQGV